MASELIVQTIQGPSSGANANKVLIPSGHTLDASGGTLVPSAGAVIQVVQEASTTHLETSSSGSWIDVGGVLTITPTSSNSKVYLINSATGIANAIINFSIGMRLLRNINSGGWDEITRRARQAYFGSGVGSYAQVHYGYNYLDSPSTNQSTQYKAQIYLTASTNTRYNSRDSAFNPNTSESTLVAMEIAG